MSLIIRSGLIQIIDDTADPPVTVFDSDERLFTATDLITGSVTFPARVATWQTSSHTNVDINSDHSLGFVNADADIVLGSFQVTTFGGSQGIAGIGAFNAGGTYVHYQSGVIAPVSGTPTNTSIGNMAAYTFFAEDGQLYLNERVMLYAGSTITSATLTVTLLSVQFDYKLFVGTLV